MGCLRGGLVLRGHTAAHGHARILATRLLLLLEVLVVGHLLLLLVGHVAGVHAGTRHVALGRVDVAVSHILGGLGGGRRPRRRRSRCWWGQGRSNRPARGN